MTCNNLTEWGDTMLPPDYFTNKEDRLLELYRQLEDFILKDITRRLLSAGEMTATADRLIWKLKQMGESQVKIERQLRKMTGLAKKSYGHFCKMQ